MAPAGASFPIVRRTAGIIAKLTGSTSRLRIRRMAERSLLGPAVEGQQPTAAVDITALVVAHHAGVYRYACRLCGCPTEAEDLTQQTFLIAQRKLHQLRE